MEHSHLKCLAALELAGSARGSILSIRVFHRVLPITDLPYFRAFSQATWLLCLARAASLWDFPRLSSDPDAATE